jgi:putative nucleotidyltransferase with HDIG domain
MLEADGGRPRELDAARRVRLLKQLAAALDARYPETHGHSRRVARHAAAIAKRMGLPAEEVARIRTAAAIHDVGKIAIPAAIVEKPGRLTDAEFAEVRRHAEIGAEMAAELGDEDLTRIVRHHHERLDGAGYPDGLAGDGIPIGARIIAVADTFDAITSTRPYRSARRHKVALSLLGAEAGAQLDPDAVRAFRRYYSGHRPVAAWALALNGPRQLIASLAGEAKLAGTVTAATLATVAAGGAAIPASHADRQPLASAVPAAPTSGPETLATAGGSATAKGEAGPGPADLRRQGPARRAGGNAAHPASEPLLVSEETSSGAPQGGDGISGSPVPESQSSGGGGSNPGGRPGGDAGGGSSDGVDLGGSNVGEEPERIVPTVTSTVRDVVDTVDQTVQEPTATVNDVTETVDSTLRDLTQGPSKAR